MILGVDKAILLISLEFTHATATDGAGLGLRPGCFVPPLHGRFMGQAWASLQHGVLEFQLLVLFRTGPGSGPASFLLHFYESKQVTSQQMEGKRMHSLPVGGRRHLWVFCLHRSEFVKRKSPPPISHLPSLCSFSVCLSASLSSGYNIQALIIVSLPSVFHSCPHGRTEAVQGLRLGAPSVATDPLRQLQAGCLWPFAPDARRRWNGEGEARPSPAVSLNRRGKLRQR